MMLKNIPTQDKDVTKYEYKDIKKLTIEDISKEFVKTKSDFFIVLDEKKPFYIMTATDIIDALISHSEDMLLSEYIRKFPKEIVSFKESDSIFNAYKKIRAFKIHHIILTNEEGEFVSVISSNDLASFLSEIAIKDEMTGLFNKRFFEFILDRYNNDNIEIGTLFLDIDNFKDINDKYGHDKGDEVIKEVAKILKKHIRSIDYAFRFGGDEFVIFLLSDENVTQKVANRLDKDINSSHIDEIPISISIGYAHKPTDSKDLNKVVKMADEMMYKIKREKKSISK